VEEGRYAKITAIGTVILVILGLITLKIIDRPTAPSAPAPSPSATPKTVVSSSSPTVPNSSSPSSAALTSIVGRWLSTTYDYTYYFVATGGDSYLGEQVNQPACGPVNIELTEQSGGLYSGTTPLYEGCTNTGETATITIQVSANGQTAQFNSYGCSDCGPQNWIRKSTKP
jgi:hypothetical protein